MAGRLSHLLVGSLCCGAAAMTLLGFSAAKSVDASVLSPEIKTEAASPSPAKVALVAPAAGADQCSNTVWPYVAANCVKGADAAERDVRVIALNRNSPRVVPLPSEARVTDAASTAPSAQSASQAIVVHAAVLPPPRPSSEPDAASPSDAAEDQTTASLAPAPSPTAKSAPRSSGRVARAERSRARVVGWDRGRASVDWDAAQDTTTYRYPDGREVVVRSEPRPDQRRHWVSDADDSSRSRDGWSQPREYRVGWMGPAY